MQGFTAQALGLQRTIVHALMMRDLQAQQAQSRVSVALNIIEPTLLVMVIFTLRLFTSGPMIAGIPTAVLVTTGYMPVYFHRMMIGAISAVIRQKASLLMFPKLTILDAALARALGNTYKYTIAEVIAFSVVVLLSKGPAPHDPLLAIIATLTALFYSVGVGLMVGSVSRIIPAVRLLVAPLMRAMVLVSGSFYLATEVPTSFLKYLSWNPLFHMIEMLREAIIPGYISPVADASFIFKSCLVVTLVGLWSERLTRRYIRS